MDWFSSGSSKPVKNLEFYQQKLLNFLFSAEGRDDFRCLNIPVTQLGFYSPVHFLSCIPSQMFEPFRNDKLFLATNGEIRKGDKVLLLVQDNGSEGIVQSAVFKGRRIGKSGEPEILLDGHRKTYTEDEVVPYKAYLREQLGTALIPEESYVITEDGILEWEEPTWEPGQEVYYKPEKRWAVILSDELSPRGRIVVNLKMEQTSFKKEKIVKMPLDDLKAIAVPLRVPLKKQRKVNSVDDLIQKVNEEFKEIYQVDVERQDEQEKMEQETERKIADEANRSVEKEKKHVKYEDEEASNERVRQEHKSNSSNGNGYAVVMRKDSPEVKENEYATMTKKDKAEDKGASSLIQAVLRPKRTKRPKVRPATEYIPISSSDLNYVEIQRHEQQQPPLPERNRVKRDIKPMEEPPKFKSCNNLASGQYSDDDLEPFELVNYTNSLRSSARKIIQRQMAEGSGNKSASLKLRQSSSSKPHVTEVFSWNDEMGRMTRRTSETTAVTHKKKETHLDDSRRLGYVPMISTSRVMTQNHKLSQPMKMAQTPNTSTTTSPVPPLIRKSSPSPSPSPTSSNNLNKSLSQPDMRQDVIDSAKKPSAAAAYYAQAQAQALADNQAHHSKPPPKPPLKSRSQNPLDYEFSPLSSSELVKKQLTIVNRVLHEPQFRGGVLYQDYILPKSKNGKRFPSDESCIKIHTCASSDSSSHDNDSGRGSYQYLTENVKGVEELVGVDHVMGNGSSMSKQKYITVTPIPSEESVYANENMTIYSQNQSHNQSMTEDQNHGQRETSPTRRYIKNRSCSRNSSQKYNGGMEDIGLEDEYTLPLPFNPGNLAPVAGIPRGLHGSDTSSFADCTLYAMFACSNIFDSLLLFSKPGQVEKGIKRDVRRILRDKIVTPLRTTAYCKSENVAHLREAMLPLSSKMHSSLMDAEEFLHLLFDCALDTESFIELSNGTNDFMHQIIARPKDRSKSQTVQFMLETSLDTSGLKFKGIPQPALFLCMPRCKGRLVYYEAIIPTLQLNVTRLLHKGPKQCVCEMAATLECMICHQKNGEMALDFCQTCKGISDQVHFRLDHDPVLVPKKQRDEILNLHSIICTRGNRYVSFVKVSEQKFSPWLFFDPMSGEYPEVTILEDFGKWLDSLEKQPGHYREFSKLHPLLKRIMTDSHIYIYSKTHMVQGIEPKESMRI